MNQFQNEQNQLSFGSTKKITLTPSIMDKCYIISTKISIIVLILFAVLQNAFPLYSYGLYAINIYPHIMLKLGIDNYSNTTIPITPWLYLTEYTSSIDLEPLFMILNSIGGILITFFTWLFAITTGHNNKIAFSSGLIILSSMVMLIIPYITIECLLFTIFLLGALLCLYQGWTKTYAPFWLITGFLLTGIAGITGGLVGFVIPCFSSILFLIWSGQLQRARKYDGALSFGIMLIMILYWASLISSTYDGRTLINTLFNQQIMNPIYSLVNEKYINWKNIVITISLLLPWIFIIPFLPWTKFYTVLYKVTKQRKDNYHQIWLWSISIVSLLCLIFIDTSTPFTTIILYPILSILIAQGLTTFSETKSYWLYSTISICFLLIGLSLISFVIYPFIKHWVPTDLKLPNEIISVFTSKEGILIIASTFIILSIILLKFTYLYSYSGGLFTLTLWTIPITFLFAYYTTPALYPNSLIQSKPEKILIFEQEENLPAIPIEDISFIPIKKIL